MIPLCTVTLTEELDQEDGDNLETLLRRSKYRTTIAVMAELADLETGGFVQETAAGSMLERLFRARTEAGKPAG